MQPSLILPSHVYVPRHSGRRRYVSKVENGVVAYHEHIFGIPFFRTQNIEEFARWAHEEAQLRSRRSEVIGYARD